MPGKDDMFTIMDFFLMVYALLTILFLIVTMENTDYFPAFILYFAGLLITAEIETKLYKENAKM